MNYSDKQQLFKNFLQEWQNQFSKIPYILKFISSYPELRGKLKDLPFLDSYEFNESQLEWISLIAQLDNPIETKYFKPWWVPITKNDYEYFIDLSKENLPIFQTHFYCREPYRWYKKVIIQDMCKFLISVD